MKWDWITMSDKYWEVKFTSRTIQVPGNWPEHVARQAMIEATTAFINNNITLIEPLPEIPEGVEVTFGSDDDGDVPQAAEGID